MTTQVSTTDTHPSNTNPVANKWINTILFIGSAIVGLLFNMFLVKLGAWFELESKIPQYKYVQLLASLIVVAGTMVYVRSRSDLMTFFYETYDEMTKVVFPDKNQSFRLSIFVIIWVTIFGFVFTLIDLVARYLISLIAKL